MPTLSTLFVGLVLTIFLAFMPASAMSATQPPSAELAKKCREMALKAHPPGRPGTTKSSVVAERDYFQNCIANQGRVPPGPAQK
jgi:hypothetical protein